MGKSLWLYIVLSLSANALAIEAPNTTTPPKAATEDIEKMINTLEDPESREALIKDLHVLMEAKQGTSGEEDGPVEVTELWDWTEDVASDTWESVVNANPREVFISVALSIVIIIGALTVRWLILGTLTRLYARLAKSDSEEEVTITIPPTLRRMIEGILVLVSIVLIAESWGANMSALMQTDTGARFAQSILSIGLILAITMVVWHAGEIMINRGLRARVTGSDNERRLRRADTLAPLAQTTLKITIGVIATLLILSEIGINIGPLLAGAGILGLAIGFGAQTLVKDLITGVTILLEDAASLGDVVETGGHIGTVEEMRIRVLQLRDLAGVVHVIPYSEVAAIKNYTKEFSYYVFDLRVAYRENTDEIVKVMTEIDEEIRQDDTYRDMIMEPLEILGVNEFADSAVIIKARIKTTPHERWTVGREFNRRIKKRFDELNIEIPFPHTTLYIGEPKEGQAPAMPLALAEKEGKLLEKMASGTNE